MYIQVDDQQVREVSSGYFRLRGTQKQVHANILTTLQMRVSRTFYSLLRKITVSINGNKYKKKTKVFKPSRQQGNKRSFHTFLYFVVKKKIDKKNGVTAPFPHPVDPRAVH